MSAPSRREQILATASQLFRDRGYHATSMRDIAEVLGLQAGSLYVHISSKEEVLFEIVDRGAQRFLDAVAPIAHAPLPAPRRLREAMRVHLQVMARHLDMATVFFHEWRFLDGERRQRILAKRDRYEELFRRIVADGVAEGAFRPVDVKLAARAVLSIVNWFYHWYRPDGPLSAEEIADRFADLVLAGLQPRDPYDAGADACAAGRAGAGRAG